MPNGEIFVEIMWGVAYSPRLLGVRRLPPDGGTSGADCADGEAPRFAGYLPAAMQADGKLLAIGLGTLERHLPDGSLDPTFGRLGTVAIDNVYDVTVMPNGDIVAGGAPVGEEAFRLTRLTP
jgi:hypothetical protein